MSNFYDKVAKKFGGYGYSNSDPEFIADYLDGDPETIFAQMVEEFSSKGSVALDVGCGDGIFTFKMAYKFKKILGIDSSKELLAIANQKNDKFGLDNVEFIYGDAADIAITDSSFEIIINRRGPSFYQEYSRLLKSKGHYIEIGIGEKDAISLKKVFGRGQNYGQWDRSRLNEVSQNLRALGLKIVFAKDYYYNEYYKNTADFELFLQGVPIFEDFDSSKDSELLQEYYSKNLSMSRGVKLERHRVVIVAEKSG